MKYITPILFLLLVLTTSSACLPEEMKIRKLLLGKYQMQGYFYSNGPPDTTWLSAFSSPYQIELVRVEKHYDQIRCTDERQNLSQLFFYLNDSTYTANSSNRWARNDDTLKLLPNDQIYIRQVTSDGTVVRDTRVFGTAIK
ncbi:MAG: hypothetical protein ACKVTZ_00140 [Bacteroidia bacterium]